MPTMTKAALVAALLAATAMTAARAEELVVFHGWSSPAEVSALKVLEKALNAKGDTWKDLVIAHDSGSNVNIVNMIAGGNPPDVFMEPNPDIYRELNKQGLGFPLDDLYAKIGATANFPAVVTKTITVDGKMMKAPVALHVDGMLFYNKDVAQKAGVDPTQWKSLDDMFADYDKVKAAGFIPIAVGAQEWQEGYLFHALMAALTGNAIFDDFYGPKPDKAVLDSPELKQTFEMIRKFQQHADDASANRAWNDTTNLVITGKALLQIHGDWMKGEFLAAGKKTGVDFGCINIPGTKGAVITVDAWGFLKEKDPAKTKAEEDFASVVVDPQVQADFSAKKGSTPLVLNAPTDQLDDCNKATLAILKDPTMQHPTPHNTADADWRASIWQTVSKFWADPDMTVDDAVAQLKDAYDGIF